MRLLFGRWTTLATLKCHIRTCITNTTPLHAISNHMYMISETYLGRELLIPKTKGNI